MRGTSLKEAASLPSGEFKPEDLVQVLDDGRARICFVCTVDGGLKVQPLTELEKAPFEEDIERVGLAKEVQPLARWVLCPVAVCRLRRALVVWRWQACLALWIWNWW